jgi:uncharacterized membrane protein YbhN (UPF0104 family)
MSSGSLAAGGSKPRAEPPDVPKGSAPPTARARVITLLLLMILAVTLLTAVPALRPVLRTIRHINPVWIIVAIALELGSCVSFVIVFRLFFDRLQPRDARALAWTEQASGALLPGGGAGGLAIGGWLIHLTGVPTDWIVRRSGGLFFLTSAVNSASLIISSLALIAGASGPHTFTLTALPMVLTMLATGLVAALPRILRSRRHVPAWVNGVVSGVRDAEQTTFMHPSWRLAGALGYLGLDMAVLWITLKAVGEPISVPALVLAYNIGYLSNILPIPGGIGVLDAGLAGALLLYGASPAHVTAAVLVYHAIALWTPGLGGTLAYLQLRPHLTPPVPEAVTASGASPLPASQRKTPHANSRIDSQSDSIRLGDPPHRRTPTRALPWTRRARTRPPLHHPTRDDR